MRKAEPDITRIAYSIEEAATALGIGRVQLGGLVRIGRVPHLPLGKRVLIGKLALEQWLTQECLANAKGIQPTPELVQALTRLPVRSRRANSTSNGHLRVSTLRDARPGDLVLD